MLKAEVMKRQRGFTLVELIVVLAIIATLTGLYLPALQTATQSAALLKARSDLQAIDGAMLLGGAPPAPLPEPPPFLAGVAGGYQIDGDRRAYLPLVVDGRAVSFYGNSPSPRANPATSFSPSKPVGYK